MKLYWTKNKHPNMCISPRLGMPKYRFYDRDNEGYPSKEVLDRDVAYLKAKYMLKTADELGLVKPEPKPLPEKKVYKAPAKKKGKAK